MKYPDHQTKHISSVHFIMFSAIALFIVNLIAPPVLGKQQENSVVKAGDSVTLHVTCMEPTGEIIMTTLSAIANDASKKKSRTFIPQESYTPLLIIAGNSEFYSGTDPLKVFKNELVARLSEYVIGRRVGQSSSVELTAPVPANMPDKDRFVRLFKNFPMDKQHIRPKSKITSQLGKPPQPGDTFPADFGLQWKVSKVSEEDVTLLLGYPDGNTGNSVWGRVLLHDRGEKWNVEIQPELNRLVRVGHFMGYIAAIDDQHYTLDYGYPFGKETLSCYITILSITSSDKNGKQSFF